MGKENTLEPFKELAKVKKARAEVLFWRAEYRKRQFAQNEPQAYQIVRNSLRSIRKELDRIITREPTLGTLIEGKEFDVLQGCVFLDDYANGYDKYIINGKNVFPYFSQGNITDMLRADVQRLTRFSMKYDYFASELFFPRDMEALLKGLKEGEEVPPPPVFHANFNAHGPLPEDVLTMIRCNPDLKGTVNFEGELWEQVNYQREFVTPSPYANMVTVCDLHRTPDFVVLAQVLSPNFDLKVGARDVMYNMAWQIYQYKTEHNIELTPDEAEVMVEFFESEIKGKYGANYSEMRAIGLWLWDIIREEKLKTNTRAYEKLRETAVLSYYKSSDNKTFSRHLKTAEKSIEAGEVLSVQK